VIGRVLPRGTNLAGLLYYLFGPGTSCEHLSPHLVAGWRHPAELEPAARRPVIGAWPAARRQVGRASSSCPIMMRDRCGLRRSSSHPRCGRRSTVVISHGVPSKSAG
jgi:hypothetical protein